VKRHGVRMRCAAVVMVNTTPSFPTARNELAGCLVQITNHSALQNDSPRSLGNASCSKRQGPLTSTLFFAVEVIFFATIFPTWYANTKDMR
jgi:hypothetical protein